MLVITLICSIFYPNIGGWIGAGLIIHGLIWPQLAYLYAKYSPYYHTAEYHNQFVDACFYGLWCSTFDFQVWPTVTFFLVNSLNNLVTGGVKNFVIGFFALSGTMTLSGYLLDSSFQPDSSLITSLIAGFCIYSYAVLIGYICRIYINKIHSSRVEVQNQRNELIRANEEISAINEVVKTINSTLDLDEIMDAVQKAMKSTLNYTQMCLFIPSNHNTLIPSYFRGEGISEDIIIAVRGKEFPLKLGSSIITDAFQRNEVILFSPITEKVMEGMSLLDRELITADPIKSLLIHPLTIQGKVVGVIAFANNEEDFNQVESSISTLDQHLSQIAGAVNNALIHSELSKAKTLAEQGTRAKSEFLANMSHEIRTPMNAILGLVKMAQETEDETLRNDYLNKVDSSAKNLLTIINDILDFSKIEAGKVELSNREFSLSQVLSELNGLMSIKAEQKGLIFKINKSNEVPDYYFGDALRLGQVLLNLVGNSIKFTDHGHIFVNVKLVSQKDNETFLEFSVEDTGIGLSESQAERLFQSFAQADASVTRKFGGTGLGLSISKHFVELMNGCIWVESKLNEGCTFYFRICLRQINKELVDILQETKQRSRRVLIIDSDKQTIKSIAEALQKIHFIPEFATDETKALDKLATADDEFYGCIIVADNNPSALTSFPQSVKASTTSSPLLMLTTENIAQYANEQNAGASNYTGLIPKPINEQNLIDNIVAAYETSPAPTLAEPYLTDPNIQEEAVNSKETLNDKHVLLVEDNEINQLVAEHMLLKAGMKVVIANNGEEALEQLSAHNGGFDIILMDIQMPEMDGHTATQIIRATKAFSHIPIIAMTAHAFDSEKQRCIESGMNDHISKPINPEIVYSTMSKWLN
ncbi:response regulator [Paraneptunicella aestuarii]|uniref:response regulator n=1 Tax=Paraneptunicella aestuarii TaxID=2831148 RepID=UPI001E2ED11B|nr:response regulator [Paraneptunicella aestuarii]UAA37949.1 response regulator [Paraneptunicella aestuarii]